MTLALVPNLPEIGGVIWQPACGGGPRLLRAHRR
jgi:hypothetical protein